MSPKAAVRPTDVVDLMQRLKESLAQNTQRKSARSRALPAQTARESAKRASSGRR
jgi:non-homologous end joining protein Ku